MTNKLLNKTQKIYLIYSIITVLIFSPIFYIVTEKLYLDDADETLRLNKERFIKHVLPHLKISDIATWNSYNPENLILKFNTIQNDTLFSRVDYSEIEKENEPYRIFQSPIIIENAPYLYTERISLLESSDLQISLAILFMILISLLLIGILVITRIVSKKIWKPFYGLINQIENFEIDKNILPHFSVSTIEEFNRLNHSVENLINKNLLIYKTQREFIDNAAHELQTPLAIFRGKLDLLIQREDITEGQAEILETINDNINRLIKLNKNLLILSKIDRGIQLDLDKFSLTKVLEKQFVFFKEQAISQRIDITLKINYDVIVNANKNLTEILFSNLILNAIQHNYEQGEVDIEVNEHSVIISNTSESTEIPKGKLYNRFEKSNQNQKGNGLGLAIVQKITSQNNWDIEYEFSKNRHVFLVRF